MSWDPDWDTLFASDDGGGRMFERTRHGITERRLPCAGSIDWAHGMFPRYRREMKGGLATIY